MNTPTRPLLFLDVDGPLLPFGRTPEAAVPGAHPTDDSHDGSNPLATRLDSSLGPLLSALPCDLVWATTWMHEANAALGPALGLPTLPVVEWPGSTDDRIDHWFGLHWKTRTVVDWAARRPFIWIDDEISDSDREWVSEHHPDRALLYRVDPRIGLRHNDFAVLAEWLTTCSSNRTR